MAEPTGHDPTVSASGGEPDSDYAAADRRPLASRSLGWVQAFAGWLIRHRVSPNGISASSVVFALVSAVCLLATRGVDGIAERGLWLAVAVTVQLRLLANMFDGMVAVGSGSASPLGELYNEVPDRISDVLVLVALGFVAGSSPYLGFAAATLAVFVAYVRAIGAAAGAGQVFGGVMTKPKRMFFVTLLCLFQAVAPVAWRGAVAWRTPLPHELGPTGLLLVLLSLGCVVTSITRLVTISRRLRSGT